MKKNIVLGMIASAALLTTVLVGSSADAQQIGQRLSPGGAVARPVAPMARPVGPNSVARGYGGPRSGYYRPGWGPRYYGPPRGAYYGPRGYYYDNGAAAALGILGGLAVGSAIVNAPGWAYYDCHIERRRVWVEGWGWRVREVEVCP